MGDPGNQFDREEEILFQQMDHGEISESEYREAIRELRRDYQSAAQDAGDEARNQELERW